MVRLADLFFRSEILNPREWAYNVGRVGSHVRVGEFDDTTALHATYRNRVRQSPVIVADEAVRFFLAHAKGKALEAVADFPNVLMPYKNFFLEAFVPSVSPETPFFGWFFEQVESGPFVQMLVTRGITPEPELHYGFAAHLAFARPDRGDMKTCLPAFTTLLQIDQAGKLLAVPTGGFPYHVYEDNLADYKALLDQVELLLHAALFAVCLTNRLSYLGTKDALKTVVSPKQPKRNGKLPPSQRNKFPLRDYIKLDSRMILDDLRTWGLVHIGGLPDALRRCGRYFGTREAMFEAYAQDWQRRMRPGEMQVIGNPNSIGLANLDAITREINKCKPFSTSDIPSAP